MTSDIFDKALEEWTRGCDPQTARVRLFERVRDLPFAYPASRDPEDVLRLGKGSCSGKHALLAEMFRRLGLPVRHMICTHRFNESPIGFPDELQEMLRKNEIIDLHDYLQVQIEGIWVDVDATWPAGLREYGFPINEDWDGRRAMVLGVVPEEHSAVEGSPQRVKDELLSKLVPRQRMLRKQFLEALAAWIDEVALESGRDGETG
jgi:hypothetical protein